MAQGQDLPIEMLLLILDWFCLIIMDDYVDLGREFCRPSHFDLGPNQSKADHEPPSPAPLRSYVSVLKTCKYFRNIITARKFKEAKTVPKLLQALQHRKMQQFVDGSSPSKPRLRVSLFKEFVGCFWHNPQILRDGALFAKFFPGLQIDCQWTILPYLRQWIYRQAKPTSRAIRQWPYPVDIKRENNDSVVLALKAGSLAVRPRSLKCFSVISVEPYYGTIYPNSGGWNPQLNLLSARDLFLQHRFPPLGISTDVEAVDPDTWWYILSPKYPRRNPHNWFLVRWYEENGRPLCKVYCKGDGKHAWIWRPDSPWNPYHWNRDMSGDDALVSPVTAFSSRLTTVGHETELTCLDSSKLCRLQSKAQINQVSFGEL